MGKIIVAGIGPGDAADITPASGHTKITVAVKDSNGKAVGAGSATLEKAT